MPRSIVEEMLSSEKKLAEIPSLSTKLRRPDFVSSIMSRIKKAFPQENLPLSLILGQICASLEADEEISRIIQTECERNFHTTDAYPSFMFTCGLVVYVEYIRLQGKADRRGGGV